MSYENLGDMKVLTQSLYECLRYNTPTEMSTTITLTKDLDIQGYHFRKDAKLIVNMDSMHHDKDQW